MWKSFELYKQVIKRPPTCIGVKLTLHQRVTLFCMYHYKKIKQKLGLSRMN